MFKLNVDDARTTGNYAAVVAVLLFNIQTFGGIIFAFSHPSIIPQFMEYSQDLRTTVQISEGVIVNCGVILFAWGILGKDKSAVSRELWNNYGRWLTQKIPLLLLSEIKNNVSVFNRFLAGFMLGICKPERE